MVNKKITLTPDIYFREVPKVIDMTIRSELYSLNEFTFAVAVILSAQATDKKVNEVTPELFKIASNPSDMFALGLDELKQHLKVLSFFNNKAKNIIALSQILTEKYDSKLPQTQKELMALPGIGQKTANVIMNVLWGAPNIGVDTHVFRLSHRFGWADKTDNTPERVENKLIKIIPAKYHMAVNHIMVLHGRHICQARRPKCDNCPVASWCNSSDKIE